MGNSTCIKRTEKSSSYKREIKHCFSHDRVIFIDSTGVFVNCSNLSQLIPLMGYLFPREIRLYSLKKDTEVDYTIICSCVCFKNNSYILMNIEFTLKKGNLLLIKTLLDRESSNSKVDGNLECVYIIPPQNTSFKGLIPLFEWISIEEYLGVPKENAARMIYGRIKRLSQ